LLELSLPGCVYLYAGEELGLPEVLDIPDAARQDPIFIRTEGRELGRDGCRIPLPWTSSPAASFGFSPTDASGAPWMPQPSDWGTYAADAMAADHHSILAVYREAVAIRRESADLRSDAFEAVLTDDADLFAYHRAGVLVVVNTSGSARSLPADLVAGRSILLSSVTGHTDPTVVPADAALWLTAG
jgi:alpha-glucosidase